MIRGSVRKLRSDGLGKETEVPMNDLVDIGLFDKKGNILYLQKHALKTGKVEIHIDLKSAPYKGGIDPINKLLDKSLRRQSGSGKQSRVKKTQAGRENQ